MEKAPAKKPALIVRYSRSKLVSIYIKLPITAAEKVSGDPRAEMQALHKTPFTAAKANC